MSDFAAPDYASRAVISASRAHTRMVARWSSLGIAVLGACLGGLVGGFVVVGVTLVLKAGMDLASRENTLYVVVVPLLGLALATLVLHGLGRSGGADARPAHPWRTFPPDAIRADISGDVIECEGVEERFPWRLAPIRALAIVATVGSGGAMGTEAPAAYLGVAAGVCLGDRGRWWRSLLRPAALAGGAAGVSALMAAPLVGTVFMLELGLRKQAPVNVERSAAALVGGFIGWAITAFLGLEFIRLVVPREAPQSFTQAAVTALLIGALAGGISSLAGLAVNRAKKWKASPSVRLAIGGAAIVATAIILAQIATPTAAVGPGGGAILWAESANALPWTLLCVCALRATATTAAVAAGGCGGVFVPFLAVGDIAGRVFAPGLEVSSDLAGAAGAAGGIAGGYRLPITALVMVVSVGGPRLATLTCIATVVVAFYAALGVEAMLTRLKGLMSARRQAPVH
jgi:CIC family chloride channel protein